MTERRKPVRYSVQFDERAETWYVSAPRGFRLPLERAALEDLIALYNNIHRGRPLNLAPREILQAMRDERRRLQQTVRQLYDFIDAEISAHAETVPEAPVEPPRVVNTLRRLWRREQAREAA
jgi:hypothetical protein